MQVGPLDVEQASGGGEVPAGAAEDGFQVLPFAGGLEVAPGEDALGLEEAQQAGLGRRGLLEEGGGELVRGDRIDAEDDQPLAQVAQLTDVARQGCRSRSGKTPSSILLRRTR